MARTLVSSRSASASSVFPRTLSAPPSAVSVSRMSQISRHTSPTTSFLVLTSASSAAASSALLSLALSASRASPPTRSRSPLSRRMFTTYSVSRQPPAPRPLPRLRLLALRRSVLMLSRSVATRRSRSLLSAAKGELGFGDDSFEGRCKRFSDYPSLPTLL